MGRPRRIDQAGDWHHVMNRMSGRRIVFRNDADRRRFLDLVAELDERFGVQVHTFCLMDTHFHLLVKSVEGELSAAMQWLSSRFTRLTNEARGVDGPIFRGRFRSVRITRDSHLVWLFRYVNANPIGLGWQAPLVDYEWSALASHVGVDHRFGWLHHSEVRRRFGPSPDRLLRFVEGGRLAPAGPVAVVGASSPNDLWEMVELSFGFTASAVQRGDSRAVFVTVWVDALGREPSTLAAIFDIAPQTASALVRRSRARVAAVPDLRATVGRVVDLIGRRSHAA